MSCRRPSWNSKLGMITVVRTRNIHCATVWPLIWLMAIKTDWQGDVIGRRWAGKSRTILSSIQTKCPVHSRLTCVQLILASFVLCDSGVKSLRIVKKVNSQRQLHLCEDFSFSFLCCHPEIIRKLESKLLHSVSYQGLKDLPSLCCLLGDQTFSIRVLFVRCTENISISKNAAPFSPHTHSQSSPACISCCFPMLGSRTHTLGFTGGVCLGVCGCIWEDVTFPVRSPCLAFTNVVLEKPSVCKVQK